MFQTFRNAWKIPELKSRLLFTLGILIVYRLGSAIPVPFVSGDALTAMFANGSMLTYLDMMSGGALSPVHDFRVRRHTLYQCLHHRAAAVRRDPVS